jgi:hypothetical protein
MLCFSSYLLCFLFSKIGDERQNKFCLEVKGVGEREGARVRGRDGPNNVCMYE